ncbi:MAG: hypothetical protein QN163_10110 [Armatimonadota bacterium]|nr:hypothetical protein [Armatimonadota bacterium]MDR5697696.1 hypothetical protein [Armatimonadota bacterium]
MNERLWDAYERVCMVEMRPLPELIARLRSGEFGQFGREEVVAFLARIRDNVLANIHLKAGEHPAYAERAEQTAIEQERMFERLIASVEADWPD